MATEFVFFCGCGQKMKVTPDMFGRTGKCPGCHQEITITRENTRPYGGAAVPPPPPPPPAAPRVPGVDQSDAPDMEDLLYEPGDIPQPPVAPLRAPTPPPPPRMPPAPPRVRGRITVPKREFGIDTVLESFSAALDLRKALMALGLLVPTVLVALVLVGLPMAEGLRAVLVYVWISGCLGVTYGGLSRLVFLEIEEKRRPRLSEGWVFILRRFLQLFLLFLIASLFILIVAAVANGLTFYLGKLPGVGTIVLAILAIPLFAVNFLLLVQTYNLVLLPCIMGVRDCGPFEALGELIRLSKGRGMGQVLVCRMFASAILFPVAALVSVFVYAALALVGAVALYSNDELMQRIMMQEYGTAAVVLVPLAAVVLCYLAFLVVLAVAAATTIYTYILRSE